MLWVECEGNKEMRFLNSTPSLIKPHDASPRLFAFVFGFSKVLVTFQRSPHDWNLLAEARR